MVRASNPGMTTAMAPTATYNETMQDLVKRILEELGEDPSREGLVKTPKRVVFMSEFPRTVTGKVAKSDLRAKLAEETGQKQAVAQG